MNINPYLDIALENHKKAVGLLQTGNFYDLTVDIKASSNKNYPTFVYLMAQFYTAPIENEVVIESWAQEDNPIFHKFVKHILRDWSEKLDIYALSRELREYLTPDNVEELVSSADETHLRVAYRELVFGMIILWELYNPSKRFWEGKQIIDKDVKGIDRFDSIGRAWLLLLWLSLRNHPLLHRYVSYVASQYEESDNGQSE
jgi:hypothetical protein